jgi:hypothetical protein
MRMLFKQEPISIGAITKKSQATQLKLVPTVDCIVNMQNTAWRFIKYVFLAYTMLIK